MAGQEGIEYLIELSAKIDGALKMVRALEQTTKATTKADAALKKMERQATVFGKAATYDADVGKKAWGSFIGNFASDAILGTIKGIANGVYGLGQQMLHTAGESERLERSFGLLLGAQGPELLEYLEDLSKHTEFTGGDLKGFAQQLLKAGFAGEGLKRALAASTDLAALSGNKNEGMAGAIGILGMVNQKGGISEKQLVGLGLKPDAFYGRLAEQLGVGQKTVEKQIAEGKIKSEVLLEALYTSITEKTSKPLGGAGQSMSTGFLAQFEKLKDVLPNMFESLSQTEGFGQLTEGLMNFREMLEGDFGQKAVGLLGAAFGKLGGWLKSIDFKAVGATMTNWLSAVVTHGTKMWNVLGPILSILGSLVSVMFSVGKVVLSVLLPPFYMLTDAIGWVLEKVSWLVGALSGLVSSAAESAAKIGSAIINGIVNGIKAGASRVLDAIKSLGGGIIEKFSDVLLIRSPSRVFAGFGMQTAIGFEQGLEIPDVAGALEDMVQLPAIPEVPQVPTAWDALGLPGVPELPSVPSLPELPSAPSVGIGGVSLGGGGGGGVVVNAPITVNVNGSSGDAQSVGEAAAEAVRLALASLMEQMRLELAT